MHDAAETFAERHAVYGDNYLLVGNVMKSLFPDRVELKTVDDHNRFHLLFLSVVKLTRYVNNWKEGGHADSARDASVYWAMLESVDADIEEKSAHMKEVFEKTKGGPSMFSGDAPMYKPIPESG